MHIIRVTKTEFELEDGTVYPIEPPLEQEMSVDEFQKHYDFAAQVVKSRGDARGVNTDTP